MQFLEEETLEIAETPMAVNVGLGYSSSRHTGFNGFDRRIFHRESKDTRSMDGRGVVRVGEIGSSHSG